MSITPLVRDLAIKLGLTDYGKLLFTCFSDDIIREAYIAHKQQPHIKDPMRWIWSECRRMSKERNLTIDYDLMKNLIDLAGYTPENKVYLSDEESQPRYTEPRSFAGTSAHENPIEADSHINGSSQSPQKGVSEFGLTQKGLAFLSRLNRPAIEEKIKEGLARARNEGN